MQNEKMVCPECGVDLTDKDIQGHSLSHWPDYLDPVRSSKTAIKRKEQLAKGGVPQSKYRSEEKGV